MFLCSKRGGMGGREGGMGGREVGVQYVRAACPDGPSSVAGRCAGWPRALSAGRGSPGRAPGCGRAR